MIIDKTKLHTFFQSVKKLYAKSKNAILFSIHLLIYKADHFFIYNTFQVKRYTKYIPIFLGLLILCIIDFYRFEIYELLSSNDSFKALSSLALSLGSALVGVVAIVFTLIIFSMQINIERLPYGLFYSLSSDKELMLKLGSTFLLAVSLASLSLVQNNAYSVLILFFLVEGTLTIFFLLYSTYKRALKLINPHEQLMMIHKRTYLNLKWWDKRFQRAKPLINTNTDNNFDRQRHSFFNLNPHYFNEIKNALNFIDVIVQKHLEGGDYIVAEMGLNTFVAINDLYIQAKKKTFFSFSPFLDTGLWNDEVINKTLENLRLIFSINLKKNDERALNIIMTCYINLAKLYVSIEYQQKSDTRIHANLASQCLYDDVEKLLVLKNPDLLMNGIRNIENIVKFYIQNGLLTDTVIMIESIGRIGIVSALDKTQVPVVQVAMNAFSNIMKSLLISKNRISFVVENMNKEIKMLVQTILQHPSAYSPEHSLGTYFSYNNTTSLMSYLTDLANALLEQESIGKNEQKILDNILVYSEKSYQLHKDLFLLAVENQSLSVNNFLAWIEHFSYLLLMLSKLEYSKKDKLERRAIWFLSIISFVPKKKEVIKYVEIFNLTETLFQSGEKFIEEDLLVGVPTVIELLTNWSFKIGEYDEDGMYPFVLGLMGAAYLTISCKCEYTDLELLKQIEDNTKKYILSNERVNSFCMMVDKVINEEMNSYGSHDYIEKSVLDYKGNELNDLFEKMKNILKKKE